MQIHTVFSRNYANARNYKELEKSLAGLGPSVGTEASDSTDKLVGVTIREIIWRKISLLYKMPYKFLKRCCRLLQIEVFYTLLCKTYIGNEQRPAESFSFSKHSCRRLPPVSSLDRYLRATAKGKLSLLSKSRAVSLTEAEIMY